MKRKLIIIAAAAPLVIAAILVLFYAFQPKTKISAEPGEVTEFKLAGDFEKKWSFRDEGGHIRSLASEGNIIYCACGGVSAIDAATGVVLWKTEPSARTPLAAGDGLLVYGVAGGTLYAFDSKTGDEKWHTKTAGSSIAPVISAGAIYISTGNGATNTVTAIDALTGHEKWHAFTPNSVFAIAAEGHTVSFLGREGSTSNLVYSLDAASGNKIWSFPLPNGNEASITAGGGLVYIMSRESVSGDSKLSAVEANTGAGRWEVTGSRFSGALKIIDGTLLFGGDGVGGFELHGLDSMTGSEKWTCKLDDKSGPNFMPVAARDGLIYFGGNSEIDAADAGTGELKWRARAGGPLELPPIIADDSICFVYGNADTLYALPLPTL